MFLRDLFEALSDIKEISYGSWTIRYYSVPKDGKFPATAISRDRTKILKVVGDTQEEAIELAKKEINKETQDSQEKIEQLKKPIKVDAYLNAPFVREVFSKQIPTAIHFYKQNDEIFMEIANEDWFTTYKEQLKDLGYRFVRPIYVSPGKAVENAYLADLNIFIVNKLGLKSHARYVLEDMGINSDKNRYFKLIFDSNVYSGSDKIRLKVPAVTISTSNDR